MKTINSAAVADGARDEEMEKEEVRKERKRERARAYYERNKKRIIEKARQKREEIEKPKEAFKANVEIIAPKAEKIEAPETEKEKGGIQISSLLFVLIAMAVAAWVARRQSRQGDTMSLPIQNYKAFDIGGGKTIQIQAT